MSLRKKRLPSLNIPIGTQPNSVLTLENKGIPKLGNPVARGNQKISIKVQLPTRINEEEKILLEKLAANYSAKGRQYHPHKSGLFDRLFSQEL